MAQKTATRQTEGNGKPGQKNENCVKTTTMKYLCQAVKFALPYIAGIITNTRFTAQKSLFLDRLIVLAEGGLYDF